MNLMGYNVRVQPANITRKDRGLPTPKPSFLLSNSLTTANSSINGSPLLLNNRRNRPSPTQSCLHLQHQKSLQEATNRLSQHCNVAAHSLELGCFIVFKLKASPNHLPRPGSQNFSHENAHFLCDLIHDMTLLSGVTLLAHFPTIAKVFISLSSCMPDRGK